MTLGVNCGRIICASRLTFLEIEMNTVLENPKFGCILALTWRVRFVLIVDINDGPEWIITLLALSIHIASS